MVGAVEERGLASFQRGLGDGGAVGGHAAAIGLGPVFGLWGLDSGLVWREFEDDAAGIWEVAFGGVEDLEGCAAGRGGEGWDGGQEIPEADEPGLGVWAGAAAGEEGGGDGLQSEVAADRRGGADEGDTLAGAEQDGGQSEQQEDGALAFGGERWMALEVEGLGVFEGEGDAGLGFPFAFAQEEAVALGAAAPVDSSGVVAVLPVPELPEGVALAAAAAAVEAGGGNEGQAFGFQDEFGQAGGEGLGLAEGGAHWGEGKQERKHFFL